MPPSHVSLLDTRHGIQLSTLYSGSIKGCHGNRMHEVLYVTDAKSRCKLTCFYYLRGPQSSKHSTENKTTVQGVCNTWCQRKCATCWLLTRQQELLIDSTQKTESGRNEPLLLSAAFWKPPVSETETLKLTHLEV